MSEVRAITFTALAGLPEVHPGADLAALILAALRRLARPLAPRSVIVVAQKVVSKAEGRFVELASVTPSNEAHRLAAVTGKDARLVEVILQQSEAVVRVAPNVLIVRHRLGFVMANAGVDRSNVPGADQDERVLLLPQNPDASAERLRDALSAALGEPLAVLISDSFGRPWRRGVTNVALGCAGLPSLVDRRGERDRNGRVLEVTELALGDAVAAGAGLGMGEAAESTPVILVEGLSWSAPERSAQALLRSSAEDLFR